MSPETLHTETVHDPVAEERSVGRSAWRTWAIALLVYTAVLIAVTWPVARHAGTRLPSQLPDPLMHLWVMRWYKSCAIEGRLPFMCPEIQYPSGARLGQFSPMHLQALLYWPLSSVLDHDVLCYNLLWFGGFLFTGLSAFALARGVARNDAAAWLGGLLAMLCGPMMVHANAHLELIYAGGFSLFMAAWLAFVDQPDGRRLVASVGAFLLLTMGAAYYLVLAVPPAIVYLAWRLARERRVGARAWLFARSGWLLAFVGLVAPPLALLFASQLWAVAQGDPLRREFTQFDRYKAEPLSYLVPTPMHALGGLFPAVGGESSGEGASYLGVVTLGLLAYAAMRRVRFPRAGFWWSALGALVVLSLGASLDVGPYRIPMPGLWLWNHAPGYQLTRNPGRFNLLAAQCAAVIAASALAHWLRTVQRPTVRLSWVGALALLAAADLRVNTHNGVHMPGMPGYHRAIAAAPLASRPCLLEGPMTLSGAPAIVTSACGYWQSLHGARTSAGYSGHGNLRFNEQIYHPSPINVEWLNSRKYARTDLDHTDLGVVKDVNVRDYAWLFCKVHGFNRVVLHQWQYANVDFPVQLERLKMVFLQGLLKKEEGVLVYDVERFGPPSRQVLLATEGWRFGTLWEQRPVCPTARTARMVAFDPRPGHPVVFRLDASAFRNPRLVRLLVDDRELVAWTITPGAITSFRSPPMTLGDAFHTLELRSDGDDRPRHRREQIAEGDERPYSLRVRGISLEPVNPQGFVTGDFSGEHAASDL